MQDPNAATTDQAPSGTAPTEPTAPAVAPPPSEEGRDAMGGPQSARRSGDDEARASGELAEAAAVLAAHPEVHVIVLLVDERPETVTSFRSALEGGEVVSSTFDRPADQHAAVAELAIEHAKRLVEYGNDVVVLLDSLTGLARAFNLAAAPGGRTIHGELDAGALGSAKRVFGTGRNVEDGGSLTVLATVLSDSGSNIDDVILTELLRGANSALHLEPATVAEPPRKLPVGAAPQAQKALLAELNG